MATGETKDVGYQIGVSKTVPYSVAEVWRFLVSPAGVALWLGEGAALEPRKAAPYETAAGTTGEVRSFRERDRVRLTWRPRDWDHDTTVQVAVSASGAGRTVLRFHQEWLADADERARQREHWRAVLAAVLGGLNRDTSPV
ncbi:SRPBCC family protein [Qaidamihabitans albus]|uniref:SRPBCC family protein n=1 Tax=Qaidamihabitans albus TaxID=2795733 RepID=UPI0027DB873F|nr:SRPBCC domain-containing protein [Qaidamihabitans albus]